MFVYTVKASRLKYFALTISCIAILLTLAAIIPKPENLGEVAIVNHDYTNIATNADRVTFLKGFGYEVEETPLEVMNVTVPSKFDSVYEKYNDLQRAQGLNLKRYCGKNAVRYTYKIANYSSDSNENVVANVLILNNRIIGGDICCLGENGFIHGFERTESGE